MTEADFGRYLARIQDARTEEALSQVLSELEAAPRSRERETLLTVARLARDRRAREA